MKWKISKNAKFNQYKKLSIKNNIQYFEDARRKSFSTLTYRKTKFSHNHPFLPFLSRYMYIIQKRYYYHQPMCRNQEFWCNSLFIITHLVFEDTSLSFWVPASEWWARRRKRLIKLSITANASSLRGCMLWTQLSTSQTNFDKMNLLRSFSRYSVNPLEIDIIIHKGEPIRYQHLHPKT